MSSPAAQQVNLRVFHAAFLMLSVINKQIVNTNCIVIGLTRLSFQSPRLGFKPQLSRSRRSYNHIIISFFSSAGFLGENPGVAQKYTFVMKDHMLGGTSIKRYHYESVILLIRNPYFAHIAEFNRMKSEGKVGFAKKKDFASKGRWCTVQLFLC